MGTLLRLDSAKRPRQVRRRPIGGDAQVVLFTGVRYDRGAVEKGQDPNGAQPGRKRI